MFSHLFFALTTGKFILHNLLFASQELCMINFYFIFFCQNEITQRKILFCRFLVHFFLSIPLDRRWRKWTVTAAKFLPAKLFILFDLCFSFLFFSSRDENSKFTESSAQFFSLSFRTFFLITASFEQFHFRDLITHAGFLFHFSYFDTSRLSSRTQFKSYPHVD